MYTVLEVIRQNPQYKGIDVLHHFEKELNISYQLSCLQAEITKTRTIRHELRVLRAQRTEIDEGLRSIQSDIDMEVFLEYPPRKGSEAERENMRLKLRKENEAYQSTLKEFKDISRKVLEKEDELEEISQTCKNARKILEVFSTYSEFIKEWSKTNN